MRYWMWIGILIVVSTFAFGYEEEYSQEFRDGYLDGYDHGFQDQEGRVGFDYRHDYEFQKSGDSHYSYRSQSDCEFRLGYVEGYSDGYFHHSPLVRDTRHDTEAVIAFAETGYHGSSRTYAVGRYDYLEDGWDDKIQSMRIQGRYHVVLYDKPNFQGDRIELDHDSADLAGFRKKAASMVIEPIGYK